MKEKQLCYYSGAFNGGQIISTKKHRVCKMRQHTDLFPTDSLPNFLQVELIHRLLKGGFILWVAPIEKLFHLMSNAISLYNQTFLAQEFRGLGPGGVSLLGGATCRGSVDLGSVCLFKKTIKPSWCILLVKDQFIHRGQLVRPNNYYLSTCTRKLAYHHCNSCTAQLLLVVQKMDYVIHWTEWISIY